MESVSPENKKNTNLTRHSTLGVFGAFACLG